jgi:hypothetical protein
LDTDERWGNDEEKQSGEFGAKSNYSKEISFNGTLFHFVEATILSKIFSHPLK